MNRSERADPAAVIGVPIPRGEDGAIFPAPWAARAFAMAVALNERGVFTWTEWSKLLGSHVAGITGETSADAEAYWLAWLAALEAMLLQKKVALEQDLLDLKEEWQEAAERTPHGQPIELRR